MRTTEEAGVEVGFRNDSASEITAITWRGATFHGFHVKRAGDPGKFTDWGLNTLAIN